MGKFSEYRDLWWLVYLSCAVYRASHKSATIISPAMTLDETSLFLILHMIHHAYTKYLAIFHQLPSFSNTFLPSLLETTALLVNMRYPVVATYDVEGTTYTCIITNEYIIKP